MYNALPDEILLQVEKPARYVGREVNMVKKNPSDVDIRFAFCFAKFPQSINTIGSSF